MRASEEHLARLGRAIYASSHITGRFVLRSGAISGEYFDKYRFEADPALLDQIGEALAALVPQGAEVLAGLELGGVPLAVAAARHCGLPVAFVRKKAKDYGTCRLAEGAEISGRKVVVVEDVVTSGGQVVASAEELRSRGAELVSALCVIDREAGGPEALGRIGLRLDALFTMSGLKEAAGA